MIKYEWKGKVCITNFLVHFSEEGDRRFCDLNNNTLGIKKNVNNDYNIQCVYEIKKYVSI